jgi:hypothetical protein
MHKHINNQGLQCPDGKSRSEFVDPGLNPPDGAPSACGSNEDHRSPKELLQAESLLGPIWRSSALIHQIGFKGATSPFANRVVHSVTQAVARAKALSDAGLDAYFACAEFLDPANRTASNAKCASAFWLDIDCGPDKAQDGKGYATVEAALAAVHSFCDTAELPLPTHVVNSGAGLHLYWCMEEPTDHDDWIKHAKRLKQLTATLGLLADPSRTADIASVLRIPGTLNHKYSPPRPVVLETAAAPVPRDALLRRITAARDHLCIPATAPAQLSEANGSVCSSFGSPDLTRLASALRVLDPDCDEATWSLRRIAPLAREARAFPELAAGLYALARTWSSGELRGQPSAKWQRASTVNGKAGAAVFAANWTRFLREEPKGAHTTLGTIYRDAKLAGWTVCGR